MPPCVGSQTTTECQPSISGWFISWNTEPWSKCSTQCAEKREIHVHQQSIHRPRLTCQDPKKKKSPRPRQKASEGKASQFSNPATSKTLGIFIYNSATEAQAEIMVLVKKRSSIDSDTIDRDPGEIIPEDNLCQTMKHRCIQLESTEKTQWISAWQNNAVSMPMWTSQLQ